MLKLSWRNRVTLDLYHRCKAMPQFVLPSHVAKCPVAARNWHMIDQTLIAAENEVKLEAYREAQQESDNDG